MGLIQDRPTVVLGAALVVAAGLAVGAGIVFANAGGDAKSAATSPTMTPTPTPTPTADVPTTAPTIDVTSTPKATPAASATPTASASPTASATASARTTTYPYPKPSRQYDGLTLRGTLDPGSGTTDTTFHVTLKGSDGDGKVRFAGLTYGDGTAEAAQADPTRCRSYPPLTAPPGPYRPEPSAQTYTFSHRYTRPGRYTLTMHLTSNNADCKPNGPAKEARDAAFTVTVIVPAPVPSPSASP